MEMLRRELRVQVQKQRKASLFASNELKNWILPPWEEQ